MSLKNGTFDLGENYGGYAEFNDVRIKPLLFQPYDKHIQRDILSIQCILPTPKRQENPILQPY